MAFGSASADLKLAFSYHFSMKLQMYVVFRGDFTVEMWVLWQALVQEMLFKDMLLHVRVVRQTPQAFLCWQPSCAKKEDTSHRSTLDWNRIERM